MKYFLLLMMSFSSLWAQEPSPPIDGKASRVMEKLSPMIFQVKVAKGGDLSKSSYGSGFVVGNDGLIMTNYHVISSVLMDKEKGYKAFVVMGKENLEASIVHFSRIDDLALLKIDHQFEEKISFNLEGPKRGEEIYSIGKPEDLNMSIVKGTYNGVLTSGIYEKIQMSNPLNSGMSGGPTVNRLGEIVGVNVSVLRRAENLTFAVPGNKAHELLQEYLKDGARFTKDTLDKFVSDQLTRVQTKLISEIHIGDENKGSLGRWSFAPPNKGLKCWTGYNKEKKRPKEEVYSQWCSLKDSSYLKRNTHLGTYSLIFHSINNIKRNPWQFFQFLKSKTNEGWGHAFRDPYPIDKDLLLPVECNSQIVVNKWEVPIKINYCMNGFKDYQGLFNASIHLVTLSKREDALILKAYLNSFTSPNILKFIEHQLDAIRPEAKKNG